jgi:hypothetical protein
MAITPRAHFIFFTWRQLCLIGVTLFVGGSVIELLRHSLLARLLGVIALIFGLALVARGVWLHLLPRR